MPSVLVLDHEEHTRELLAGVIASGGYTVFEAADSASALGVASREHPDLAVVDILMPSRDGYEFVRRLRRDVAAEGTGVVFSAVAAGGAGLWRLAESCGVEHILSTTCGPEPILETITLALQASKGRAARRFFAARFDREYVDAVHRCAAAQTAQLQALSEELGSSRIQYRALFELSAQPISIYDRVTHRIVAVNSASVTNYGYTREEFLTMTLGDFVPPEDIRSALAYISGAPSVRRADAPGHGRTLARPSRHLLKDGSVIDVEVTSCDVVLDGRDCRMVLSENVTARRPASGDLAAAQPAAPDLSTLRSAFLANIGHELRTPMTGVIGMNELLLATELTAEQRVYAAQVARSGEKMLAVIDDVLDVAKIEAGGLVLVRADFPLREALERACAEGIRQAGAKGLSIELRFDERVPEHARGDGVRLERMLACLVSNAVKFTASGYVKIRVGAQPGRRVGDVHLRVTVADTGIGIAKEALERVFDPFTQADASSTRAYAGAGLGLAITRNLAALMGGTLGAESLAGRGSTFWFELDLSRPLARAARHDFRRVASPAVRAVSRGWSSRTPHGPARRRSD